MISYTDLLVAWHAKAGPDHPIWRRNSKMEGRRLAEWLGIRTPTLLAGLAELDDLPLPMVPFVLKPNNGFGGKGTLLLNPLGGDCLNMRTGIWDSWQAW